MSGCTHGNPVDYCDRCDEVDSAWDRGYAAGTAHTDKIKLLLRECDAALGMLSDIPPVWALRKQISATVAALAAQAKGE